MEKVGETPYLLLARYEGGGIWEVLRVPARVSVSPGFYSLVRAHHQRQLSPDEEEAFQTVGLERTLFFHVVDIARAHALN